LTVSKPQSTSARKQQRASRRKQAQTRSLMLILGGLLILAAAVIYLARQPANTTTRLIPPKIGQPMPDLALNDLSGELVRLSDYAGQPVLINAWATWCPPCRAEMPLLNEYYLQHKDEGFVILAVNAGETHSLVDEFISQTGFNFPVLLDPDSESLSRMGVFSFPTSILVGRDGTVKKIHVGIITPETMQNEIAPLLELD
jgi:cytochrome c biogenesis protein CcmG, thiol:disulfide interchange protein DsbE